MHPSWLDVLGDPIRIRLLEQLLNMGEASAVELGSKIDASEPALRRHLETLVALGIASERRAVTDGVKPGRPATKYRLLPNVRERTVELFTLLTEPLSTSR
jgi:predicted ArsR family transcriptional regulator